MGISVVKNREPWLYAYTLVFSLPSPFLPDPGFCTQVMMALIEGRSLLPSKVIKTVSSVHMCSPNVDNPSLTNSSGLCQNDNQNQPLQSWHKLESICLWSWHVQVMLLQLRPKFFNTYYNCIMFLFMVSFSLLLLVVVVVVVCVCV